MDEITFCWCRFLSLDNDIMAALVEKERSMWALENPHD
ncbi:hypothetical protein SLEP1_g2209 [Rubroshorea leprosula]|uniref:Uncharacterized protein n=1 Tax=Rubroshorea leprosula TaxID=152421 RepID=A0AAV5HGE9_9ROSI|nr:hypothetical protein SLEP1_g2209 [Rubroshorea leprosula]